MLKPKHLWTDYPTTTHAIEAWQCECGCRVERMMKEQSQIVTYPNGGVKYNETK
jgi:hypothetical protein